MLAAGNIVLRAVFGESYALISRILFGFLAAGSIANIVLTRTESEEGYTLPNVIFAAVSALLVLTWPGTGTGCQTGKFGNGSSASAADLC